MTSSTTTAPTTITLGPVLVLDWCKCADPDCSGERFVAATQEDLWYAHPGDVHIEDGVQGFWTDCETGAIT